MGPPDGSGAGVDFIETECEDERFLPLIQAEASQIDDSLWLGSEDNVRDLVFLKVANITRIVTIMPYAVDPTDCGRRGRRKGVLDVPSNRAFRDRTFRKESVRASRPRGEGLARRKTSREEQTPTERGASTGERRVTGFPAQAAT